MDNKSTTPMSCEQVDSLLNEYLDGELDSVTAATVEAHLAECDSCRQTYEQLRAICGAVGRLAEPVPDGLHKKIMTAVRTEARVSRRRRLTSWFGAGVAAMLCVGLVATAAVRRISNVSNNNPADGRSAISFNADAFGDKEDIINNNEHTTGQVVYPSPVHDGSAAPDDVQMGTEDTRSSFTASAGANRTYATGVSGTWIGDDWTLTLSTNCRFTYTAAGSDTVSGDYSFSDGQIKLSFGGQTTVYDVAVDGENIAFTYRSGTPLIS